jgi:hypothetical protein
MNDNLSVRHLVQNEIHLRLDDGEIAMGTALQNELASNLLQVTHAAGIDPNV